MSKQNIKFEQLYRDDYGVVRVRQGKQPSIWDPPASKHWDKQFRIKEGWTSSRGTVGKNKVYFSSGVKSYSFNAKSKGGKQVNITQATKFTKGSGYPQDWARSMSLKGGKNPIYGWQNKVPYKLNGKLRATGGNNYWGDNINKSSKAVTSKHGTFNPKQFATHLLIAAHQVHIQAANFRVMVGYRAQKVFQDSFRMRKFYSQKGHRWRGLSPFTIRKRLKRGTGTRILNEFGDLRASIKVKEHEEGMTRVYTDAVHANPGTFKKASICYAGYHNEGEGTYGKARGNRPPKPYIKRQFMGHSSYLNPIMNHWLRRMMKQYLFDSVFKIKR